MSSIEYFEGEPPLLKNDILMPDINLYNNVNLSLGEEEKNEEKSISEESNFQSYLKREIFLKEMAPKNLLSENDDDKLDDSRRYEISTCKRAYSNNLAPNFFPGFGLSNQSDVNTQNDQINSNMTLNVQKDIFYNHIS